MTIQFHCYEFQQCRNLYRCSSPSASVSLKTPADASMRVGGGRETSGLLGPAGEGVAMVTWLATWHGGQRVRRSVPVVKAKECKVVQDFVRVWRNKGGISQFGKSRSNGAICGVISPARFT